MSEKMKSALLEIAELVTKVNATNGEVSAKVEYEYLCGEPYITSYIYGKDTVIWNKYSNTASIDRDMEEVRREFALIIAKAAHHV